MADFNLNDPHYMTPGAREAFASYRRTSVVAFVTLAVAFAIGIWGVTERANRQLRKDINNIAQQSCAGSIPTLKKFNGLIEVNIVSSRNARVLAQAEGDLARVKLYTNNIIRLQNAKLDVPTKQQCFQRVIIQE